MTGNFQVKKAKNLKPKCPEFLDISTDFETLNKQETQQQIDIILSFVESLGGAEGGIRTHVDLHPN